MTLHRKKRHRDRIWSWREGGRIRSLKHQGLPDTLARAIAAAEFSKRKSLAALFGLRVERSATLAVSYLPKGDDYDDIRFHIVVPDAVLENDEDRKMMAQFMQASFHP